MIEVDRVQWGVGNGGFHTEDVRIRDVSSSTLLLRVVYDCGTLRRAVVLDGEIQDWSSASGNAGVSVLVISHFDRDHVNGMQLLKSAGFEPDHVILPYLSPAARVLQMLANVDAMTSSGEGARDDADRIDDGEVDADRETGHLAADPEGAIGELWPRATVTLIGESSNVDVDPEADPDPDPDGVVVFEDEEIQARMTWSVKVHPLWGIDVVSKSKKSKKSQSTVQKKIWKYVWGEHQPGPTANLPSDLKRELARVLAISPQDVDDPPVLWQAISAKNAWKTVAGVYRAVLAKDLNPYSLLLWSGPGLDATHVFASRGLTLRAFPTHRAGSMPPWERSGGWLGTGDAIMSTKADIDLLAKRMPGEIFEVDVINAPHHGSSHNSTAELYRRIPSHSGIVLTPADGRRWGHPHHAMLSAALTAGHAIVRVGDSPMQRFMWSVTVRA